MTDAAHPIRRLAACGECRTQYDASALDPGTRFHCSCGATVTVPHATPHDAAVVRCSACGASRDGTGTQCTFCGAAFTLHERDLHTLCPGCFTRIADQARFCHACGLAIAPCGKAGERTELTCPACTDQAPMHRRVLGNETAILECDRCAGLWLDIEAFRILEERAQANAATASPHNLPPQPSRIDTAFTYRKCPRCTTVMHRRNYGRKSGVLIDVCDQDGIWFDHQELDRVLDWIRRGGMARTALHQAEERRAQQSRARMAQPLDPSSIEGRMTSNRGSAGRATLELGLDAIGWLIEGVFK